MNRPQYPCPPEPSPETWRVIRFSVSASDRNGVRHETSVNIGAPVVLTLAAALLLHPFVPTLADALGRRLSPTPPPMTAAHHSNGAALPSDAAGRLDAPGAPYGREADVITPLNVRDASALVMPPSTSNLSSTRYAGTAAH